MKRHKWMMQLMFLLLLYAHGSEGCVIYMGLTANETCAPVCGTSQNCACTNLYQAANAAQNLSCNVVQVAPGIYTHWVELAVFSNIELSIIAAEETLTVFQPSGVDHPLMSAFQGSNITIIGILIKNMFNPINVGLIQIYDSKFTVHNCHFVNIAPTNLLSFNAFITITNTSFIQDQSTIQTKYYPLLSMVHSNLQMENIYIVNTKIALISQSSNFSMKSAFITNNTVQYFPSCYETNLIEPSLFHFSNPQPGLSDGSFQCDFQNVVFKENFGIDSLVYVNDPRMKLSISNCKFTDNNQNSATQGSIIKIANSLSINIQSVIFSSNYIGSFGGSVYLYSLAESVWMTSAITFDNCLFSDVFSAYYNSAGGAILAELKLPNDRNATYEIAILNSTFQNVTVANGGALSINALDLSQATANTLLKIQNSTFQNCSANTGYGGGAVITGDILLFIDNSRFESCRALEFGGAVYASVSRQIVVQNSHFTNCSVVNSGGAVLFDTSSNNSVSVISNCTFQGNGAGDGGALIAIKGKFKIVDSVFEENYAKTGSGGALYLQLGVGLENSRNVSFISNKAWMDGGAIFWVDVDCLTNSISKFYLNKNSARNGGGMYYYAEVQSCETQFMDWVIVQNSAAYNGGGIFLAGSSQFVLRASVIANSTANVGGAMFVSEGVSLKVSESLISYNEAVFGAGGILLQNSARLHLLYSEISYNIATQGAGISQQHNSTATIFQSRIIGNVASNIGGGLLVGDSAQISINRSNIDGNSGHSGGAISFYSSVPGVIRSTSISNNKAVFDGAGIYLSATSNSTQFDNVTFANNTSYQKGGAIYCFGSSVLLLSNSQLGPNNGSPIGGALAIDGQCHVYILNTQIVGNKAGKGGGVASDSPDVFVQIENSHLYQNIATSQGGGLILTCSEFVARNCTFSENWSENSGGAAFIQVCAAKARVIQLYENCTFYNNSADFYGGAVYVTESSQVFANRFANSSMEDECSETDIGPFTHLNATFQRCLFIFNQASRGGAMYRTNREIGGITTDSSFISNVANTYGGAIAEENAISSVCSQLHDLHFSLNSALWGGSTIAVIGSLLGVPNQLCDNCTYTNNSAGYQTTDGFATPPLLVGLRNKCPSTQVVANASPWLVQVEVYDEFDTQVTGEIFEHLTISISLSSNSSNCSLHVISNPNVTLLPTYSIANFTVYFTGKQGALCDVLVIATTSNSKLHLRTQGCSVSLQGCSTGQKLADNDTTCVEIPFWNITKIAIASLTVLSVVLLCVIVCGLLGLLSWWIKKRVEFQKLVNTELPDWNDKSNLNVTLEDLKKDPNITIIDWEEIEEKALIGRGASGQVWAGVWNQKNSKKKIPIALKECYCMTLEQMDEAFLMEIKLTSALQAPGVKIVEMYGISFKPYENSRLLILVLELMERGSLRQLLNKKGNNIPWNLRLRMLCDAAEGLQYLHSRRVIHRDIKPENLLIDKAWTCKIGDLGGSTIKPRETMKMTEMGTLEFMSPEILRGDPYSTSADIYSFGIVLIECSKGIANADRESHPFDIRRRVLAGERPDYSTLPDKLRELVADCLSGDPKLRPTADELHIRLKRIGAIEGMNVELMDYGPKRHSALSGANSMSSHRVSGSSSTTESDFSMGTGSIEFMVEEKTETSPLLLN